MKKLFSLFLALLMALGCMSSAALADETKTITGWGSFTFNDQTGLTSYSEQLAWQEVEARLGVKVDWTTVSSD